MTQVATRTPTPAPPARWNTRRSGWRLGLHWFGVVCLMVAAGFGGYVVWLLWGTGLSTQRAQDEPAVRVRAGDRHQGPVAGS